MQGPGRELADVARAMREPIKGFGLLSDFAIRKARTALGRERMTRAPPAPQPRGGGLRGVRAGSSRESVDKVLRKHGRDIAEMQYTQKRTADMAIDLYAIAACISRTTRAIERRGEEGARREIDLTSIFVAAAERRLAQLVARGRQERRRAAEGRREQGVRRRGVPVRRGVTAPAFAAGRRNCLPGRRNCVEGHRHSL